MNERRRGRSRRDDGESGGGGGERRRLRIARTLRRGERTHEQMRNELRESGARMNNDYNELRESDFCDTYEIKELVAVVTSTQIVADRRRLQPDQAGISCKQKNPSLST